MVGIVVGGCLPPIVPSLAVPLLPSGHQPGKTASLKQPTVAGGHLGFLGRQEGEPIDLDGLDFPRPAPGPLAGLAWSIKTWFDHLNFNPK